MAKAFLSHSSKDKEIVRKVANQLGNKNCVLDEISFDPGRITLEQIFSELDSSDIFVLFISDDSLESEWVKKEIQRAKENMNSEILHRIIPIIIDEKILYSDVRLPSWIAKPYNLKYIDNEVIILKKIRQALREVNFKKTKFNQDIENNFVGRNSEMEKFENEINNIDSWTPTYIIAYNYFEGIGRRTFLKNALRKYKLTEYLDTPTYITIESKESIENFIYKLNTISKNPAILDYDFSSLSIESKIEIAVNLVKQFMDFKELIFIVDEGGIILPNNSVVNWFKELVNNEIFDNNLVLCLISKYRPNEVKLKRERKSLVYRIPELSTPETKNLFLRLLKIYQLDGIRREDKEFFIEHLKGIPSQIIYAVNLIEINPFEAKKNVNDIIEYSDRFSSTLLNHLKDTPIAYQLAILLSTNEIFSTELINKVLGDNEETSNALQTLFDLSLFNFVFGGYDYVKLNPTLSDFINRTKIKLEEKYKTKLDAISKELLEEDLDKIIVNDYSEFMVTLQAMLENKLKVPKKYFIPSLIIKNVIKEYDKGNYDYVIKICVELLENQNYDQQIIWETNYRLTLAYARTKNEKFFDHISFFRNETNNLDYYFLLGFYYRHKGNRMKALENYSKALQYYSEHSRSKREIVNIYLSLGQYDDAVDLAKDNYEKRKTNIYHIHSYFVSIIRRKKTSSSDIKILETLMNSVKSNPDIKSDDILRCMQGEYAYYIENDINKANEILLEAIKLNQNKNFPKKSLSEIYKNAGLDDAYEEINSTNIEEDDNENY
ncbi:toll/interleukin-1 receptor domain-containing protein [Kaistella sp. 97-N-M2]|uniref:toll/interleukin-1 receptor domain-containing protein n=1 Tax=Kaistella sp. 97-N-M2 TaxID=2908645 RepID=UPI001F267308|nr:toll/interleukin-1 receptor domain-containing protein [Kaistella sp. 97-N-M2]UJF29293.1 toll/interleukin-1 receptor domain-containing protein [Kaistella sp. 97-N-M2]